MSKTKKPTSDELGAQIATGQRELASIDAELDQAQARVTSSAHDDSAYSSAASAANMLQRDRDAKARRLAALAEAREDAIDRELDQEIERHKAECKRAGEDYRRITPKVELDLKAEARRHEKALEDLVKTRDDATHAHTSAQQRLKDAQTRQQQRTEKRNPDRTAKLKELSDRRRGLAVKTSVFVGESAGKAQARQDLAAVDAEIAQLATA